MARITPTTRFVAGTLQHPTSRELAKHSAVRVWCWGRVRSHLRSEKLANAPTELLLHCERDLRRRGGR